jgi:hypothetical protein
VVVERGGDLQDGADGRVPACIGQEAADDLRLHREAPRELGLAHPAPGSGALECSDEGVGRSDLGTGDLEVLAERGIAKLLVEELVEASPGRHVGRNIYATARPNNPLLGGGIAEGPGFWGRRVRKEESPGRSGASEWRRRESNPGPKDF